MAVAEEDAEDMAVIKGSDDVVAGEVSPPAR